MNFTTETPARPFSEHAEVIPARFWDTRIDIRLTPREAREHMMYVVTTGGWTPAQFWGLTISNAV